MDWTGILSLLGAGGVGGIANAITRYFLARRKQNDDHELAQTKLNNDWRTAEFIRLETRINKLETDNEECTKHHQECLEHNIVQSTKIGELQGQISGLNSLIARIESQYQTAVITCDDKGLITEWNSAATFMFGWSKEEATGRHVSMLVPPRFRGQHIVSFNRAVKEDRGPNDAARLRESFALTKDGTEIPVTILLSGWVHDGKRMYSSEIRRR